MSEAFALQNEIYIIIADLIERNYSINANQIHCYLGKVCKFLID